MGEPPNRTSRIPNAGLLTATEGGCWRIRIPTKPHSSSLVGHLFSLPNFQNSFFSPKVGRRKHPALKSLNISSPTPFPLMSSPKLYRGVQSETPAARQNRWPGPPPHLDGAWETTAPPLPKSSVSHPRSEHPPGFGGTIVPPAPVQRSQDQSRGPIHAHPPESLPDPNRANPPSHRRRFQRPQAAASARPGPAPGASSAGALQPGARGAQTGLRRPCPPGPRTGGRGPRAPSRAPGGPGPMGAGPLT